MPKLTIDGDARGGIKANLDLAKAIEKAGTEADKSEKRLTKMEKAARSIREANDPLERYNRKLADTARLVTKGELSIEDAKRAAQRYNRTLERTGQSSKDAFSVQRIQQYATGILGVLGTVTSIQQILSELQQQEREAADRTQSSLSGFGELQQISRTEEEFQRRKKLADKVLSRGITKDEGTSATIAFRLDSAGLSEKDKELFLRLGEQKFVKPEDLGPLAAATTTAQRAIGIDETGSRRDLINKALETAANVDANASQILQGVAKFGTNLKALGFSDEAGLAALEITTQARGTVGEGSTSVTAALKAIEKSGIAEKTLIETIEKVERRRAAGESVRNILGVDDNEAITGVRLLANNLVDLRRYTQDIARSQAEDPLGTRLGFIERDPVLGPALQADRAKGRLREVRNRKLSSVENLASAAADDIEARRLEENASKLNRLFIFLDRYFGTVTDEDFLRLTQTNPRYRITDPQLNQDIVEKLDRIANATEATAGRQTIVMRGE